MFKQITSDTSPDSTNTVYESESGNKLRVFYEDIPSTDWRLGVVLKDEEVLHQMNEDQYKHKIYLSLGITGFLISILILSFIRKEINCGKLRSYSPSCVLLRQDLSGILP